MGRVISALGALALALFVATFTGCSDGSSLGGSVTPPPVGAQTRQVQTAVAAGMKSLNPDATDTISEQVNLTQLNVGEIDRAYTLTTPADQDFSFSVVASRLGNAGETRVTLAHAKDGTAIPVTGPESLTAAGLRIDAPGISTIGSKVDIAGDGFARVNISGRITDDQILVIEVPQPEGDPEVIGIKIEVGPPSEINPDPSPVDGEAESDVDTVIYSSDSWQFGLPAIGVSGDRYTVVTYDGDRDDPNNYDRFRRWLQYDTATELVSGGTAESVSNDYGFWRDQEIAGLGNVIAIVQTGGGEVRADISLDRGASFPIEQVLEPAGSFWGQRLVQVAIAPDYRIAFVYWRSVGGTSNPWQANSELVMVEGTPGPLDIFNTPSSYTFSTATLLHAPGKNVTPLLMGMEFSSAGDLVIGYGYTSFNPIPGEPNALMRADFRCAVRLFEQPISDRLVDFEEGIVPMDPSVSVVGSGSNMQIFYAYEKTDGVHLRHSSNAGQTFTPVTITGQPGANLPSVHSRMVGADLRVDLLYLEPTPSGVELHSRRWDSYPGTSTLNRLTTAVRTELPPQDVGGGGGGLVAPIWGGFPTIRVKEVAPFGYDSTTDGEDVAVVIHERTQDHYYFLGLDRGMIGMPMPVLGPPVFFAGGDAGAAAPPPVLLPGLTGFVPAPDTSHSSQLRLLVIR